MKAGPRDFETAQLYGHRPAAGDLEELQSLLADPRVGATLGGVRSAAQVAALLLRFIEHWQRRGFGPFILHESAAGDFVGYAGLIETRAEALPGEIELLYALRPIYWRRGYASEASREALARGFGAWDLDGVVAFTLPRNRASWGVMEKVGMVRSGEIEHAGERHLLYRAAPEKRRA